MTLRRQQRDGVCALGAGRSPRRHVGHLRTRGRSGWSAGLSWRHRSRPLAATGHWVVRRGGVCALGAGRSPRRHVGHLRTSHPDVSRTRGAVSLEAALLIVVFVLVGALMAACWRIWWATSCVQSAAEAAARAASVRVDVGQASDVVNQIISSDLATLGLSCASLAVTSDVAAVTAAPGVPGTVSVEITCQVTMNDLLVPGLPGTITVHGTAQQAIDVFRYGGK